MTQKKMRKVQQNLVASNIRITKLVRDIIHGYIMSDGYIKPSGALQVQQSLAQEKFVDWLYEKLKFLCTETGPSVVTITDKRSSKQTFSKRFYTRALLCGFESMWYTLGASEGEKRRKRLPKSIAAFFTPTFITLWYAGDGTKEIGSKGVKFEVTAFTPEERLVLQGLFKSKFGIEAKINKAGKSTTKTQQWVLSIGAKDYEKFHAIVTEIDLIRTLFPYKLHKLEY